jgi:hypothetical protein
MDREQARAVLLDQLGVYRARPYNELRELVGSLDVYEIANPGAPAYQIEVQVMWDGKPGGDIRVMGAIDDGGWSAFAPLCGDFVLSPEGVFLGE